MSARMPLIAALALTLSACATPPGPVQVTRFNAPEKASLLGRGAIAIEAAPGMDADSLELASYRAAVARELVRLGYTEAATGQGSQVAEVRLRRGVVQPVREGGPVSVGVGGSTGSYGSGVGLGVGIDLSGKPMEQVMTELAVVIRQRVTGEPIWEGRAEFGVKAGSPLAETQLAAPHLAEALFVDFPGKSGETFEVK
ncbi:DUF4136 domain-containing protein [Croceicoccus ponticola]|uniref:DUF4136 domain-containing protein n=1 Tax=Croceicoccus ponticola TaxID=2217664 RepID=A0A437GX77_9SPHN|nr:DUF4136 domain-containing protein [Croceicoccus ponticola]RVQ67002.1 DUF4136 domain-containing protein [Croceicoccus ponticola]